MKQYDNSQPLIFIHIPKCAGTSVRRVFKGWFNDLLYPHYFSEQDKKLALSNIVNINNEDLKYCLFGHFNRDRGFGIDVKYPNVGQFITIMRDPYDQFVSEFFYLGRQSAAFKGGEEEFRLYLDNRKANYLNHFPQKLTTKNYKKVIDEQFIFVGLYEKLELSLTIIARLLSKHYINESLPYLKIGGDKPSWVGSYRTAFCKLNPLEELVYSYVKNRFKENNESYRSNL